MKTVWSPKTKVTVVMVGALFLPIAAAIAAQLVRLYYFEQTKPVHAIVNQELLQVMRNFEREIVADKERMGVALAASLEPVPPEDEDAVCDRLRHVVLDKDFADVLVFYSPQSGPIISSRPAPDGSLEATERKQNAEQISASLSATYDRLVTMLRDGERTKAYRTIDDILVVLGRPAKQYNTAHYVLVHDAQGRAAGVLGFTMDRDYLRKTLLPAAYQRVSAAQRKDGEPESAIIGIRDRETGDVIWSSEPTDSDFKSWDSRKPFESATIFGMLETKLKGASIDQMSRTMFNQNLALVLALGVVLFGGLFFTWRSVNREIELARLKSDFVSNVSHELKTPLALIRLFAETLELGRVRGEGKMQEYYATIRKESERLTGLINNLLDFSRIEAGGKQYQFEKTNLGELVGQAIETYRYQLDEKGFAVEESIACDLPEVPVDRESYSLCILNLLDNAVKYSGESRWVKVCLVRENGAARLEVQDHGIGISRKDQVRIFEKFYRAGDPLVHNTKGSGLGLSLVQHVAQAHHGQVTVESSPGQGAKFILKVPIDDVNRN